MSIVCDSVIIVYICVFMDCFTSYCLVLKNIGSMEYTVRSQKNDAVSKVNKKTIYHLTRAKRTPSAAATVPVKHALPAVRFSCLLRGRGVSFQDGAAAGKGFLCAPFWGVQISDTVQREFRARFRKDAPHRNNITRWYRQFVGTGCLCKGKSSGRPRVFNDNVERVRETGCYPNWTPFMTITFCNWTVFPQFSQECTSASQSCSSTALDRTCCKRR